VPRRAAGPAPSAFRTFDEAFAWLASRTNYETMATQRYDARTYGLARVERLLDAVGRPDQAFDSAQVVGSKGKGSTAAALASILRAAGRRTGLFTSPHLVHARERIRIDGEVVDDRLFTEALSRLRPFVEKAARRGEPSTFFEIHTAAALLVFREARCDAAVLEAGMGGRLDATTAARARVKVLTSVSLDHVQQLGRTRAAIAAEKAAVARNGVPFVSGERIAGPVGEVVRRACRAARAPLVAVGREFRVTRAATEFDERTGRSRTSFVLRHGGTALPLEVPLLGRHQAWNAALAAVAARVAAWRDGPVGDDAIRAGLAATTIRARLEPVSLAPLVLVDGAHTPASFAVLARTLAAVLPRRRLVFVVGMSADKDVRGSLRRLRGVASEVVATTSGQPRAAAPEEVAAAARDAGIPARTAPDAESALAEARRAAVKAGGATVVTGSLYLCGAVLAIADRQRA
jgi:dihydrofolate synthase/folylpolyglutamate synthase